MSDWADLGGERVISGSITIPYYGALAADIVLASSATVSAQTVLTIGDLSLVVHVVRQASFAGSRSYRLVGGYGAWRDAIGPRYYSSAAALPLSMVLGDAAREIGEQVSVAASRTIGTQYVRSAGPASRVLEQLAPDWWIAPDGTTTIGSRDGSPITTPATVAGYSGGKGRFDVATENMSDWLPGRTFTSQTITDPQTIGSTSITLENSGKVRLEVLNTAGAFADRLSSGFDQIVASILPNLAYLAQWEFVIRAVHGSGPWTLDLEPTSTGCPLPGMTGLVCYQGAAGVRGKPKTGATCLVGHRDGDPQRPYVSQYDGTAADEVDLLAGLSAGAGEHAASVEGVINLIQMILSMLTAAALPVIPPTTPPTTPPWSTSPTILAIIDMAILGAANPTAGVLEPTTWLPALAAACATKLPNPTGAIPSVAWPGVRGA